jgi:hypothetical protein
MKHKRASVTFALLIAMALVVASSVVSAINDSQQNSSNSYACIDSDRGLNYNVRGETRYADQIIVDSCKDSRTLLETYCVIPDDTGVLATQEYLCPHGCNAGVCVQVERNSTSNECASIHQPVCGTDGKTYSNSCYAAKAGITEYSRGACISAEKVSEHVTCSFSNTAGQPQKCYSTDGRYSCYANNNKVPIVVYQARGGVRAEGPQAAYPSTTVNVDAPQTTVRPNICENYRYDNCPSSCIQRCMPSHCSDGICTADCGGPGSCSAPITTDVSCTMNVVGEKGKKISWKSSCGKTGETIMDGDDEAVNFDCSGRLPPQINETIITTEVVKCVFSNSTTEQKCYGRDDITGKSFSCEGTETCTVDVSSEVSPDSVIHKMTWKSTCGGYAHTVIDGENEYAFFYCGNETTVETNSFNGASWSCYDGDSHKVESDKLCKSSEEWKHIANDYCQNHCVPRETSCNLETGVCSSASPQCGIASFSLGAQCGKIIIFNPVIGEKVAIDIGEKQEGTTISCNGCLSDDKCYPIGYRKEGNFCSADGNFVVQQQPDLSCENNFECGSNVCISNKCVSPGLIENILNWFSRLFGNQ